MKEANELLAEIIKDIAMDASSALVKKARDFLVDIDKKKQIDVGNAYVEYLSKVYDSYLKSKSLVYREEKRELSSFFEPVDLRAASFDFWKTLSVRGSKKSIQDDVVSSNDLAGLFDKGTKIVVTGIGGAGKTILMKHFCLRSIDVMHKIPVFISLRWFNTWSIDDKEKNEEPFEKLVFEQLSIFNFKLSYEYFLYSLEGDRYIFLLDGFDEIAEDRSTLLLYKLSNFTKKYKGNYIIISSRYNERILGLDDYKWFTICPLSFDQVKGLINKLEFDPEITNRFIDDLGYETYDKYRTFASVPLLLSILFITYVEKTTIPESLNDFYEEAFATLLFRHDKQKEGLQRILGSGLSYDDFKKLFVRFCYDTYFSNQYSFKESQLLTGILDSAYRLAMEVDSLKYKNDLTQIACMIIQDGREYIFIHRNFQEYYAALFVSQGTDKQQRQLYRMMVDQDSFTNKHIGPVTGTKTFEFLRTLYSIEPKRFEYIFILPILEKIHSLYAMNDNDIMLTIEDFFAPQKMVKYKQETVPKSKKREIFDAILLSNYLCKFNSSTKKMIQQEIGDESASIIYDHIEFNHDSFFNTIGLLQFDTHFLGIQEQVALKIARAIVQQAIWLYQDIKQKEAKYSSSIDFKDIF